MERGAEVQEKETEEKMLQEERDLVERWEEEEARWRWRCENKKPRLLTTKNNRREKKKKKKNGKVEEKERARAN